MRRVVGIVFAVIISLICLTGIFLASFIAFLQTPAAKQALLGYLTQSVERETGYHITLGKIQGFFPLNFTIETLTADEGHTTVIAIDKLHLSWSLWGFAHGTMELDRLSAEAITIQPPASTSDTPIAWPHLPWNLSVRNIHIEQLRFQEHTVSLHGSFRYKSRGSRLSMELDMGLPSYPESLFHFSLEGDGKDETLQMTLTAAESPAGLFAEKMQNVLPFAWPAYHLTIQAGGPWISWQYLFDPTLKEAPPFQPLGGAFTLRTLPGVYVVSKDDWEIHSPFVILSPRQISLPELSAEGPGASVHGKLDFETVRGFEETSLTAQIEDLAHYEFLLPMRTSGDITAHFTLQGPLDTFRSDIRWESHHLLIAAAPLEQCHGEAQMTHTAEGFYGTVQLETDLISMPTKASTQFSCTKTGVIHLKKLRVEAPDASVRADLVLSPATAGWIPFEAEGNISATILALQRWSVLSPLPVAGDLVLTAVLQKETIDLDLQAQGIKIGDMTATTLDLKGELLGPKQAHLDLIATDFAGHGIALKRIATRIAFEDRHWPFELEAEGQQKGQLSLSASGVLDWRNEGGTLLLQRLSGIALTQNVELLQESRFTWDVEALALSLFELKVGAGWFSLMGDSSSQVINGSLNLHEMPLDILASLFPRAAVMGSLSGSVSLSGSPESPEGAIHLEAMHLTTPLLTGSALPPLNARLDGSLTPDAVQIDLSATGFGNEPMTVSALIPARISLKPASFNFFPDKPISGHIALKGPLAQILHFFVWDAQQVGGAVAIHLDLTGTVQQPHIKGNLLVLDGTYESLLTGSVFKEIQVEIDADETQLIVKRCTATDGGSGKLAATGRIEWDLTRDLPLEVQLSIDHAMLIQLDSLLATVSGDLTLTGNLHKALLRGSLQLDQGQINIPDRLPVFVPDMEITYSHPPKGGVLASKRQPFLFTLELDVKVTAARLGLKGRGLISDWRGSIALSGVIDAPKISGECTVIQGKFSFAGRVFELTKGTIAFTGGSASQGGLQVIGELALQDYTIHAIVSGQLDSPKLSFQSDPPMTINEILSLILFNRGIDAISPFEAIQLAEAVLSLSGDLPGPDLMAQVRDTFHVDTLSVTSDEGLDSQNVSVQIGKYLMNGLFVSVYQGINNDESRVGIEADLTRGFHIRTEVGGEQTAKIGILWRKDY